MFDILCWAPLICPHLSGLLPPLPPRSLPVWIFHIAAAAGAWWGGLRSLCTSVAWVLRYAAPWRAVCHDRRVAADASRPPACLPVLLHLTDTVTSPYLGIQIVTCARTQAHICITAADLWARPSRRGPSGSAQEVPIRFWWHLCCLCWQNVTRI